MNRKSLISRGINKPTEVGLGLESQTQALLADQDEIIVAADSEREKTPVLCISKDSSLSIKSSEFALSTHLERTCANAQPTIDLESIEYFCRTWAEVGQAILARRNKANG